LDCFFYSHFQLLRSRLAFFFLQGQARRQSRLKACFKVIGGIIQQLLFLGLALLARAAGERWGG